jgi:hypothetical protein
MRASFAMLALAISPFVATVSEAQDPAPTSTMPQCQKSSGNPSSSGDESRTKKCPPPPPPTTGTATITGTVFFDLAPYDGVFDPDAEVGIAGWYVVLTGPTGSSRYLVDGSGSFSFAGLPSGATYTLCVEPSAGWTQTAPSSGVSCTNAANGMTSSGYTIVVPALAVDTVIPARNLGFYSNPW